MELRGLTKEEVYKRKQSGLSNEYASHKTKTIREIFIENIFSLFNLITLCIILFVVFFYLKNNDNRLLYDSIGIFFIAITNTSIALFQEIKSKRALDKVNLLLKKEVFVIRDNMCQSIEPSDIVVDDLIEIKRGDQIVVDGKVINSKHLEIDESLITGESIPIQKEMNSPVLSGSFCVSGKGYYIAEKVGMNSNANQVTLLAKKFKFTLTPLQKRINLILKILFLIALLLVGIEVISYNIKNTIDYSFVNHIRKIATILISLVPQGLVLTASVTFAVGVYRISKIGAIVQKLNAIESFSNVDYVCMDKTGTLTENKLKIYSITNVSNEYNPEEISKYLGTFYLHSTEKNATINVFTNLPFFENTKYLNEIPFNSSIKMSYLEIEIGTINKAFIFGAFDILVEKLNQKEKNQLYELLNERELSIYRNLLFLEVSNNGKYDIKDENFFNNTILNPVCIVSISDTIRKDVLDAINLFEKNGIKFKILTGDAPDSVHAIMKEIGWNVNQKEIITGIELDKMNERDFKNTIFEKTVFARLNPEHKLRIIKTFRKNKKHTAMIGDGVNDLPAIKNADVGIAMEEGSAITKEVADIILLKNKFSLLPEIYNEGNKIVNSVNSISKLFLTKNFLVIFLSILSIMTLLDFPLTPRRVSLLNIFSIGLPAFIITLKNNNVLKVNNFVKDVFSFVILSSMVLTISNYVGQIIFTKFIIITKPELEMALMTMLVILAVINFFIVASQSGSNKRVYYFYGTGLIVLYVLVSASNINFTLLILLKKFYEIEFLKFETWIIVLLLTTVFSIVLALLHKVRVKIINKN